MGKRMKEGFTIPSLVLPAALKNRTEDLNTKEFFKGKVVLFALPGAFTSTCTAKHLPGFVKLAGEFKKRGVDKIACLSVNDGNTMQAWAESVGVGDAVEMIADGSGIFTKEVGMTLDLTKYGMGIRSSRYVCLIEDGVVKILSPDDIGCYVKSAADAFLKEIDEKEGKKTE